MKRSPKTARLLATRLLAASMLALLAVAGCGQKNAGGKAAADAAAAQRAADEALENTYEMLRADVPELGSITLVDPTGSGVALTVAVTAGPVPHTRALDIVATYRVHEKPFRRSLQAVVHVAELP